MRLILKIVVSDPSEVPFLWMILEEAAQFADKIIICEFDLTHSGNKKNFTFERYHSEFARAFPQLEYLKGADIPGMVHKAKTSADHHKNETLMRGWFVSQVILKISDLIVSLDADEVLYSSTYSWLLQNYKPWNLGVRFRLHQLFYRPNFHWTNTEFTSPIARRAWPTVLSYPDNWRDKGTILPGYWGVHFSWNIPLNRMVSKLNDYSHAQDYGHLAHPDLLREARSSRNYPFDASRPFEIEVLEEGSPILPRSFVAYRHLIDHDVIGVKGIDW